MTGLGSGRIFKEAPKATVGHSDDAAESKDAAVGDAAADAGDGDPAAAAAEGGGAPITNSEVQSVPSISVLQLWRLNSALTPSPQANEHASPLPASARARRTFCN